MKFQAALFALLASSVNAGIRIYPQEDPWVYVRKVTCDGDTLVVKNPVFNGNVTCAGTFGRGDKISGNKDDLVVEGMVLSTGTPLDLIPEIGNLTDTTTIFGTPGDYDLDALAGEETMDACTFEFDFWCKYESCTISLNYNFGSEDYNENIGQPHADVMAIWIDGEIVSLVPETTIPVGIDTINGDVNSQYFIDNTIYEEPKKDGTPRDGDLFEADGYTVVLKAEKKISGGLGEANKHTFKVAIGDVINPAWDSWVFIGKDSMCGAPTAVGGGDPHFRRWGKQQRDTFHGECDLVVLKSEEFHQHGLDFHVRTTMDTWYSYIESGAVRVGNHIMEVHSGEVIVDGKSYSDDELPVAFGNDDRMYTVYLKKKELKHDGSVKRRTYGLKLDDSTEMQFRFYKQYMTFDIVGHADFENAKGLLGQYPHGGMITRDGQEMDDFKSFGFEWQVNPEDPTLFQKSREPQLPYEACRLPTATRSAVRKLRGENRKLMESARVACAQQTTNDNDFNLCVDDVIMTGDIELAAEW